jgi:mitotic spindle assembly checkpoint protein MAD2
VIYLYITNDTNETIEKWSFKIERENGDTTSSKLEKKINSEIGDVLRQIVTIVTTLPQLDSNFDIELGAVWKKGNYKFPEGWTTSDKNIKDAEEIKLRSFSTGLHKIGSEVAFKKPS